MEWPRVAAATEYVLVTHEVAVVTELVVKVAADVVTKLEMEDLPEEPADRRSN
jgi:hypothetical protein